MRVKTVKPGKKAVKKKIVKKADIAISAIALMVVVVQLINNSIFIVIIPPLGSIIQALLYGSLVLVIASAYPKIIFQPKAFLLIIGTLVSLLVNDIDIKYNSEVRWLLWLLLISSLGPVFTGKALLTIRYKILNYFLYGFIIITLGSFLYLVLGLPQIGRGNFSGLTNQSMILGPIASISAIYLFYLYLVKSKPLVKMMYITLSLISTLVIIFASSRLAFAGFIAGMIFLFAKPFKYRTIYVIIVISLGSIVYSRIDDGSEKVERSIDKGLVEKGMINSRELLWNDRINEFKDNPIFGVGFSSQKNEITKSENETAEGRIEPGSGYLMILSMTGIFGMLLFLTFMYVLTNKRSFWNEIFKHETYKLSIMAFFAVHFIGEGYIYSAGSLMGAFFWLMIGITYPHKNINKVKLKKSIGE